MKYLILLSSLLFAGNALAVSECTGRSDDGRWVTVHVNTKGAKGLPDQGEVVVENEENKFGYRFGHEDIVQFFEYDETSNNSAMVGLVAYVNQEYPVAIKYIGPNFVDMDLKSVIEDGKGTESKGNFLRIWKGPGYAATDQFTLINVVCSTWTNI